MSLIPPHLLGSTYLVAPLRSIYLRFHLKLSNRWQLGSWHYRPQRYRRTWQQPESSYLPRLPHKPSLSNLQRTNGDQVQDEWLNAWDFHLELSTLARSISISKRNQELDVLDFFVTAAIRASTQASTIPFQIKAARLPFWNDQLTGLRNAKITSQIPCWCGSQGWLECFSSALDRQINQSMKQPCPWFNHFVHEK